MRSSKNELNGLLKQVFEACGFDVGAYENAAEMVMWSQMHGMNGFNELELRLPDLFGSELNSLSLLSEYDSEIVIDAKQHSTLQFAAMISDLGIARALQRGVCELRILNCQDAPLIIRNLLQAKDFELHGISFWSEPISTAAQFMQAGKVMADQLQLAVARTMDTSCCPEIAYYRSVYARELHEAQVLTLIFAKSAELASERFREITKVPFRSRTRTLAPKTMRSHYRTSLNEGIELSETLWNRMVKISEGVLVESNEQSRMGAGA